MTSRPVDRRRLLTGAAGGAAALMLGGCDDDLSQNDTVGRILDSAEALTKRVQRALVGKHALAPEYAESDISPHFRSNGTSNPEDAMYQQLATGNFADWRLAIGGLVSHPQSLTLAELRALPARTQITRHDCVEGWSCIGKWSGARLGAVLDRVAPQAEARYVVFFCADPMSQNLDGTVTKYYESIDLSGAYHPQTILAYDMNDRPLAIPYGAPLRLRDERQLGYKMAKYIMRIELVADFAKIAGGKGGYWEDLGYEWYAGI